MLLAFISIAFLSKACYNFFYHLRKKGIVVERYFPVTSNRSIGVELFKLRPWFGSLVFLRSGGDEVIPSFLFVFN